MVQRRSVKWLRLLLAGSIVLPISLLSLNAWQIHNAAVRETDSQIIATSRLLVEQATNFVESDELAIALVDKMLGDMSWDDIAASDHLHRQLHDLELSLPTISSIVVMNPDGIVANSSHDIGWPRAIGLSDRQWMIALHDPQTDVVITPIYLSRVTHDMQFSIVKRRTSPDGRFNGAITVSTDPDYFHSMFVGLHEKESFALALDTGFVLAAYPRSLLTSPLPVSLLGDQPMVKFDNGVLRRVDHLPLVISYSVDHSIVFDLWLHDTLFDCILAAFGSALVVTTCILALRSYAREHAANLQLQIEMERRRETELKMHNSRRMEALGQLTAGVAHDFNNLLTVVIGNAEQIAARADEHLIGKANNILTVAMRGATLVAQMLSFARRQIILAKPYDVDNGLKQFVPMIASSIKPTIKFEMTHGTVPLICLIDHSEFELAVLNIVTNADHAMPHGGRLTISTALVYQVGDDEVRAGHYARVIFCDTGEGMSKEVKERVFEPFFTTRELTAGTGLGLSQVYGFAKQAGGDVIVESDIGIGTKLVLYLPMIDSALTKETEKKVILIVDDQRDILDILAPSLDGYGYTVLSTDDPDEALAHAKTTTIALLLTDIVMPRMSGIELARRLLAQHPETKVLMMTGYTDQSVNYPLIRKPFLMRDLLQKIRSVLNENPGRWG